MKAPMRNALLLAGMIGASGLAMALKPTEKVADSAPRINLELMIPRQFGEWREVKLGGAQIVDPQQKALLDKLYNQTLSRTYVNERGYAIMLSIAYGSDQSDALQMHKPEVCYPSQGFQLIEKRDGTLDLPTGAIPAVRLRTTLGPRSEPITYWTTIGDKVVRGGIQKKLAEMSFGFSGKIPDGMLIRVSSIDDQADRAFGIQAGFAEALVGSVATTDRFRLAGGGGR